MMAHEGNLDRPPDESVRIGFLDPASKLPLLIEPAEGGGDLISWAGANREWLRSVLLTSGGILFRGFPLLGASGLQQFIRSVSGDPLEYLEQSSPRSPLGGNIYTSTDHPADQCIEMHCENSYRTSWPLRIFFHCIEPAQQGGETPLVDVRNVFQRIEPIVRQGFAERKVMYVRNMSGPLGLPWQKVFQTDDKAEVEGFCRANGLTAEWNGERLRTRAVREPVKKHPRSGDLVWFNHALFFHKSSLDPEVRETMLMLYKEDELPANAFYGDGGSIADSTMDEIRKIYQNEKVLFPWQKGDLLMLDNMLVAHGRQPFSGPRRVLVGMSEMVSC